MGHRTLRQIWPSSHPHHHCFYFLYVQRHHVQMWASVFPCLPREDEHALIQQYCQTLGGESPVSQPQSPAQILKSVEREERGELERIIADLEEEQRCARPGRRWYVILGKLVMGNSLIIIFTWLVPILFSNYHPSSHGGVRVLEGITKPGCWLYSCIWGFRDDAC